MRLVVDVSEDAHKAIRIAAAVAGTTMTSLVEQYGRALRGEPGAIDIVTARLGSRDSRLPALDRAAADAEVMNHE